MSALLTPGHIIGLGVAFALVSFAIALFNNESLVANWLVAIGFALLVIGFGLEFAKWDMKSATVGPQATQESCANKPNKRKCR